MWRSLAIVILVLVGCGEESAPPRAPSEISRGPTPMRMDDDATRRDTPPPQAEEARALDEMRALHAAAGRWSTDNQDQCPTAEMLRATKGLEQTVTSLDPWGRAYKIVCAEDGVTITSAGADRREGTADDLHVP